MVNRPGSPLQEGKPIAKHPAFYHRLRQVGEEGVGEHDLSTLRRRKLIFLDQYVKHFNSIELNAVFYSIPNAGFDPEMEGKSRCKFQQWTLCFVLSFPEPSAISKGLKGAEVPTDLFLASIS
jgi:hypothetical protein